MKKILSIALLLLLTASLVSCTVGGVEILGGGNPLDKAPIFGGNSSNSENPSGDDPTTLSQDSWDGSVDTSWYKEGSTSYTLTTAEQLAGLAELSNTKTDFTDVTITLGANLDLCGRTWTPIGERNATIFTNGVSITINNFCGTFDGNGATISNLNVENGGGLFSISNGTIKNCRIAGFTAKGKSSAAGLAAANYGTVENCYASGTAHAEGSLSIGPGTIVAYAGVLLGRNTGTVKNCYSEGSAYAGTSSTGAYTDSFSYAGGLIGSSSGGSVINCYSTASATANTNGNSATEKSDSFGGGLIGRCENTEVANCYATGSVSASANHNSGYCAHVYAGGLIGSYTETNTYRNNFRSEDQQITATLKDEATSATTFEGATKSVSEICTASFHTSTLGWSTDVWQLSDGQFPTLK